MRAKKTFSSRITIALLSAIIMAGTMPVNVFAQSEDTIEYKTETPIDESKVTEKDGDITSGYSTAGLSNLSNEKGILVHKVSGESNLTDNNTALRINLSDSTDKVLIYKLAEVDWDDSAYSDLIWVDAVKNFVKEEAESYPYAETPNTLGVADQSLWTKFYNAMLKGGNSILKTKAEYDGLEATEQLKYLAPLEPIQKSETASENVGKLVYTKSASGEPFIQYENVPFGQYVIMATNGTKAYNPLVMDLTPDRASPNGAYYVQDLFESNLKESDAVIEKKINGNSVAAVGIGDKVHFEIEVTMPTIYLDRDTRAEKGVPYTFTVQDIPSEAFGDFENFKFEYVYYANDESTPTEIEYRYEFPKGTNEDEGNTFNYYTFIKESAAIDGADEEIYTAINASSGNTPAELTYDGSRTNIENVDGTYWYRKLELSQAGAAALNEKTASSKYTATAEPLYTFDSENLSLNVNISALKEFEAGENAARTFYGSDQYDSILAIDENFGENFAKMESINKIIVSYDATVTNKIDANGDNNTNVGKLIYEANTEGSETKNITSTVKAYTYAMKLVKADGNKEEGDTGYYLGGALFSVFKEVARATKTSGTLEEPVFGDVENVDAENLTEYSREVMEADAVNYSYYDREINGTLTRCYYKLLKEGQLSGIDNADLEEAQSSFNSLGQFSSVNTEAGVTLGGLGPGNYAVHEVRAPERYNLLAEDMLITIAAMTPKEATEQRGGSMQGFYKTEEKEQEDFVASGIYELKVLNFKGLVLPSTGGMGTMLFTVVGLFMMSLAFVFVLIKRKPIDYSIYIE